MAYFPRFASFCLTNARALSLDFLNYFERRILSVPPVTYLSVSDVIRCFSRDFEMGFCFVEVVFVKEMHLIFTLY